MITPCPHCQAEIEIDTETHAAITGQSHFACPACQGAVAVPARPQAPASVHRGINRNLLILGVIALLVLGGIGIFLASQKSGDTNTTVQNIRNEIINNSYFTQLIASGVTTRENLDAVGNIRPYGNGFIGVSVEAMTWEEAEAFASRCGAAVLRVPMRHDLEISLRDALVQLLAGSTKEIAWVIWKDEPSLFAGGTFAGVTETNGRQHVILEWLPGKSGKDEDKQIATNPRDAAVDRPFRNSLGMDFVPVPGTNVLFCIHETRRIDYAAFRQEVTVGDRRWIGHNGYSIPAGEFPNHPVMYVSHGDAQEFCGWLSTKERVTYRLPTDREWSHAVGIGAMEGVGTPEQLSGRIVEHYPWGTAWPPPDHSENIADVSHAAKYPNAPFITGYDDGYTVTSPVMSYAPNSLGIHDLGGNVAEWCMDAWNPTSTSCMFRGGSWRRSKPEELRSSQRHRWESTGRGISTGFRVVMVLENGVSKLPPVPPPLTDPPNTTKRTIDLIQAASQGPASPPGLWGVKSGELEFFKEGDIAFPQACGTAEYDLEIEFSLLTEPVNSVNLSFPTAGGRCRLVMQLFRKFPKPFWGFGKLDNVAYAFAKEARVLEDFPPLFTTGKRYKTIVKVRENALEGFLDGRLLAHWEGDLSRFTAEDKSLSHPRHPQFGVHEGLGIVHKATLIEFVPMAP